MDVTNKEIIVTNVSKETLLDYTKSTLTNLEPIVTNGISKPWPEFGEFAEMYSTKNKIADYEGNFIAVRNITNPFELVKSGKQTFGVPKVKTISRAYFKLWEILINFNLISDYQNHQDPFVYAGLAESPGGFLQAVYDYRAKYSGQSTNTENDSFHCISLVSKSAIKWNSKMHSDYFDTNKIHIHYGDPKFADGNLLNPANIIAFANSLPSKANFVTADGGIGVGDDLTKENIDIENYKEQIHLHLFYNEIVSALLILKNGGNFVLKIYDIYTIPTVQLLKILIDVFAQVSIVKPMTSRPASSEKYIVCEKFQGINDTITNELLRVSARLYKKPYQLPLSKNDLFIHAFGKIKFSRGLVDAIRKMNIKLSDTQIKVIKQIFRMFDLYNDNRAEYKKKYDKLYKQQIINAIGWCKNYKVQYHEKLAEVI